MSNSEAKVVLITGGSSGIGRATAIAYAKLGYKVAITGRNKQRLDETFAEMTKVSPEDKADTYFLAIQVDFANKRDQQAERGEDLVMRLFSDKFQRLDILINNAGFPGNRCDFFHDNFFEDFQDIIQVNLIAATRVSQLAAPLLIKSQGVIINVSSICDRLATPNIGYCVSKAGLSMLTKVLANAFDGKNVRVVTVSPGPIKTNFNPNTDQYAPKTISGRVGASEEVADLILFLASDKASFINGCTMDIDGGMLCKTGSNRPSKNQ